MKLYRSVHFDRYLQLYSGETQRRMLNPYQIKNEIETACEGEIEELTGNSKIKLTIKTQNKQKNA